MVVIGAYLLPPVAAHRMSEQAWACAGSGHVLSLDRLRGLARAVVVALGQDHHDDQSQQDRRQGEQLANAENSLLRTVNIRRRPGHFWPGSESRLFKRSFVIRHGVGQ